MTASELLPLLTDNVEAIIAACALGLTFYEGLATRKHNRLTVRPHLVAVTDFKADGNSVIFKASATLVNAGIGPAVIRSFVVLVGDEEHSVKSPAELLTLFEGIIGHRATVEWHFFVPVKGYAMKAGEEIRIADLQLVLRESRFSNYRDLEGALSRFGLLISYESIYGEVFPYDSRKHFK